MVRKAAVRDIDAMAEIEQTSFPFMPWSKGMFYDAVEKKDYITNVFELAGKVVAFACVQAVDGLFEAELQDFAVMKGYRRLGIGKELLEKTLQEVHKMQIGTIFLEVAEVNKIAYSLYEKCGFKYSSIRKDYYGKGEHAIIMRKDVNILPKIIGNSEVRIL